MMLALTGKEILYIWETGLGHHPIDQALIILAGAFPEISRDKLAKLSIGQRDSCLLTVRAHTFGSRLAGLATCPQCREQVECVLDLAAMGLVASIGAEAPALEADQSAICTINRTLHFIREDAEPNEVQQFTVDGYEMHFSLT